MDDRVNQKFTRLKRKFEEKQREVFHKTFPTEETDLYKELDSKRIQIDKLKVINDKQYEKIYPSSGKTSSDSFDFTLLHALNRNFGGFRKPRTGWDKEPASNDRTVIANLIRLKIARNEFDHYSCSTINNAKYKEIYQKVKTPLKELGCSSEELQELAPSQVRFNFKPCAVDNFVSRDQDIARLHAKVLTAKGKNALAVVVSAISGTGKTEFVKKYFENRDKFYKYNVVWINHTPMIAQDFKNLAQYVGIALKDENGDEKELNVIINQVHDCFRDDTALFVFDNYDNSQNNNLKDDLIRYIPDGPNVHTIVITSQLDIDDHRFSKFKLPSLDVAKCLLFVKEHNLNSREISAYKKILEFSGCNAFSMQQCVNFVRVSRMPFSEYLRMLKTEPNTLNVYSAVNITIEKVKQESLQAYKLLEQIAFLDKNEIKRGFFICGHNRLIKEKFIKKSSEINFALDTLQRYSLVKISGAGNLRDIISLHSIVQAAMIERMTQQGTIRSKFTRLMSYIDSKDEVVDVSTLQFFKYCLKQVIHISTLRNYRKTFLKHCLENSELVANIFCSQGAFKDFIPFLRKMKKFCLADDLQKKYQLDYWIGFCHYHRRDFVIARKLLLDTRKKQKALLKEEHPDYLKTSLTFLRCSNFGDDKTGTMKELDALHKSYKSLLGNTHPQTLITKRALAFCKQNAGDSENAFLMYSDILREQVKNHGKDHSEVLTTEHMMIINMVKRNHSDKDFLIKHLEKILNQRTRLQRSFRVEIAMVEYNLSVMLKDSFEFEKALEHAKLAAELLVATLQQALGHPNADEDIMSIFERRKSLLGANHPEIKSQRRALIAYKVVTIMTCRYALLVYVSLLILCIYLFS